MLELHAHTICSDGQLTPTELVKAAKAAGVKALAITDHDTLSGWDEALNTAIPYGLEIVPGVELSTVLNEKSLHILGFYPDRASFAGPLQARLNGRKRRAAAMVEKLANLGYPITLPTLSEGIAPGRPHIARALLEAGYIQSYDEAFQHLIGEDGPAYVHYEKFTAQEGIALLRHCSAVPVWAHPYLFKGGDVEAVLPDLVDAGLQGLEVYHPNHSPSQIKTLQSLCDSYRLLVTGGSDFHGPSANPAYQLNSLDLPMELLSALKQVAQQNNRQAG